VEAGGPTTAPIGGTDRPSWVPPERHDLTILDMPGQYSPLAPMDPRAPRPPVRGPARAPGPDDLRRAGPVLADRAHGPRRALPAPRDALHLPGHRLGRQLSLQRHALPNQSAGGVRSPLAGRLALGRHGALLRTRPPTHTRDEYPLNRRHGAERCGRFDGAPLVRRRRLGRSR